MRRAKKAFLSSYKEIHALADGTVVPRMIHTHSLKATVWGLFSHVTRPPSNYFCDTISHCTLGIEKSEKASFYFWFIYVVILRSC